MRHHAGPGGGAGDRGGAAAAQVSFGDAAYLAGAAGRLNAVTTNFNWQDRFNIWSGLLGGTFLFLSYFGCDQSQVQRYLTGRSVAQSRLSLLFNAVAKIPMQAFILFIGAMVFVFYVFEQPPVLFQQTELKRIQTAAGYAPVAAEYQPRLREPPRRGRWRWWKPTRPATRAGEARRIAEYRAAQKAMDSARAGRRPPGGAHRRREGLHATPTTSSFPS